MLDQAICITLAMAYAMQAWDCLTLQAVIKRHLSHDLIIMLDLQRIRAVRAEHVVRHTVKGIRVKSLGK
jgi:hypothetical protein